ncbi:MAG: ykoU [Chlorobi bacterium]|nr:ykoU [Chlorobiota bacterium]
MMTANAAAYGNPTHITLSRVRSRWYDDCADTDDRALSVSATGIILMPLDTYKRKRDFNITSEPKPAAGTSHRTPIFVIQEHHATRLHYDFRLEAEGVLKSWAVTKEPTLDPAVKRLAVEVEDHPLKYAKFRGDIPEGQYGAGHVEIWDNGTYEHLPGDKDAGSIADGIDAGKIEFVLHGEKLRGAFALVRMKNDGGKNWLLIKKKDDHARPGAATDEKQKPSTESRKGKPSAKRARAEGRTSGERPEGIEFSHEEKVMFPDTGYTKGDVLAFYDAIADHLLPHLRNRPVTLERLPDGLSGPDAPHFWQKNTPDYYPGWIPRVELESERGEPVNYVLVNDRQTLLYLVNQGTITFHPWLSRIDNLDRPDYVLFDLDPGHSTFAAAMTVAKALHTMLDREEVANVVKTSGKSGLHVLAPWTGAGGYDEARAWALEIAGRVVEDIPDIVTTERSKSERHGKLYLDVMQNARGHHAVPPYVVRAVGAATVSTPIRWNELTSTLTPGKFDITSIIKRLGRLKNDPMAPMISAVNP